MIEDKHFQLSGFTPYYLDMVLAQSALTQQECKLTDFKSLHISDSLFKQPDTFQGKILGKNLKYEVVLEVK